MSADPNITAFICSSYQDLIEEREQVDGAVQALGLKVNAMERFGAQVVEPIRACLDEVRASDLLVVIVGNRYGSVGDPRSGISFTEAEYRLAVDLRKPCLVYLIDDSIGVPPHRIEDDQTRRKLAAWKADLMRRHTTASFRGADDLARRVMGDLHRTIMTLTRDLRHVGSARRARSSREVEVLLDRVIAMVRRVEISRSDPAAETPDLDRSDVAELFRRYRKLGEPNPAILDGIGRLSLAVGSPRDALKRFHELAEFSNGQGDREAEAEALFNGFRAGLEARDFASAAWHLRKAWEVAPGKYALFPARYRMHRILGVSGGGVDFACQDLGASNASRTVRALLIDEFSDADRAALFQQIERLWQLSHPNVIDVVSCGWTDERQRRGPFVTIRPFAGVTLAEAVKGGTLSPKSFMALARKLASALNAAHGKELIHRDVRPANVLVKLGPKRQLRECVLAGFGLALSPIQQLSYRERGEDRASDVYLAPEQLGKLGSTPVAAKSDMVGFARTCYFALFGVPDPRPQMLAQVPAALARLLQHCAGSLPAVRPASFEDVYQQIKAVPPEAVNAWEDAWQRSQGTAAGTATTVAQPRTPPTAQCSSCDTLFPLNLNGAARQVVKCPACQQLLLATASADADSGVAVEPAYVCACPQCKKPLQLRRECAGQQVKCGHCSAVSLPRYCLIVTHGEKPRVGWRLTKGQFLIGRERIAPLTFIDLSAQEPEDRTWISRGHARLVVTDKAIAIQDGLDEPSRNGTFVNQERIARPQWKLLRLGDEVKIGSVRLRVTVQ